MGRRSLYRTLFPKAWAEIDDDATRAIAEYGFLWVVAVVTICISFVVVEFNMIMETENELYVYAFIAPMILSGLILGIQSNSFGRRVRSKSPDGPEFKAIKKRMFWRNNVMLTIYIIIMLLIYITL